MIHYEHIKGYNQSSNASTSAWTWIKFCNSYSSDTPYVGTAPTIEVASSESATRTNLGKIITQYGVSQTIEKPFTFTDNVVLNLASYEKYLQIQKTTSGTTYYGLKFIPIDSGNVYQTICWFGNQTSATASPTTYALNLSAGIAQFSDNVKFKLNSNGEPTSSSNDSASFYTLGGIYAAKIIKSASEITANTVTSTTTITAGTKCQAQYFNATSDIRAKTQVHQTTWSALDIISKLPVYNFHYSNNDAPSIGIIAQEAQYIKIDDFSLVDNIEATGENGDYMSVKESKLVYVLWKAVQEQQQRINDLEALVTALTQKNTEQ